ncbi:acyltransferase [Kutzneria sp. 744]|nr:acyltransferase [Kutzneria sp. 744]
MPAGFRPEAMLVVYGLAEATLAVTFPELGTRPVVDWVDRAALTGDRRARPVAAGAPGARGVVALGSPVKGLDVRIADPDDCRPLGERSLGEVQVRGRSVTTGYLGATVQPFSADGWLRTGDLGYFAGGQLYVTGRSKEMLIVRGGNFYPEDIEAAARTDPGVHRRRCVAFVSDDDGDGIIVLVAESLVDSGVERDELTGRLRERVKAVTGLDRLRVVLVGPHAIPRTSSGKLQRIASRTAFT